MSRPDQNYTDLIADARVWPRDGVSKGPLINALADAIEALVKERDELAAVVEKVRGVIGAEIGWESPAILIDRIQWALSTAPADALAEHDAALIESLADDRGVDASEDHDDDEWWVGYRQAQREIIHWLTKRARQVREGEA